MYAPRRLWAIAWVYILAGAYALIEQLVSIFTPLSDPLSWLHILLPRVNMMVVALPVGAGLLRRSDVSRRIAVGMSWMAVGLAGIALAIVLAGAVGDELSWGLPEYLATGDGISRAIGLLLIGLPLFVWQLRQLHSEEVRILTGPTGRSAS